MSINMDDQYRMIERNIEALLEENHEMDVHGPVQELFPENILAYKSAEMAAKEEKVLGQYTKWSTVESDELFQEPEQRNGPIASNNPIYPSVDWTNLTMLITNYLNTIRRQLHLAKKICSFCKKNGSSATIYTSHSLRVNGVLQCPFLLKCQCTYCFKNGHTTSYCPMKDRITPNIPAAYMDRSSANRYK